VPLADEALVRENLIIVYVPAPVSTALHCNASFDLNNVSELEVALGKNILSLS